MVGEMQLALVAAVTYPSLDRNSDVDVIRSATKAMSTPYHLQKLAPRRPLLLVHASVARHCMMIVPILSTGQPVSF